MDKKMQNTRFVIGLFLLSSSTVKGECKRFMSWMKLTFKSSVRMYFYKCNTWMSKFWYFLVWLTRLLFSG